MEPTPLSSTELNPEKVKKRMRIVVCTNSLTEIQYPAYTNHIQFWFRLGRSYPEIDFILSNPSRMSIDRCRNMAAKVALECEADYLLFLDDDVLVPPNNALKLLLECEADVAAGKVCIRGYPFQYMCFVGRPEDPRGLYPLEEMPTKGIEDVGAVGFSCCLIKTSVFKTMPPPYFVTGINNTEDIYFCVKARMANPDLTIRVNCELECSHILWPETIGTINREAYAEYFRAMNPDCDKKEPTGERGDNYLKMVKGA